jgi:hypothetical protein
MTRVSRYAWLAIAPAFALILYWRVPITWFSNDDFAWLGLPLEIHHSRDLLDVLFGPRAQGTVRFLGERLFFLTFSVVFGYHALPYHLLALGTWCADLVLAALIGERLTESKIAGATAAIFWTASSVLVTPIAWAAAYNEVLCAFCILLALYARMRGWRAVEWIAYLAGFGALEVIVVYPAIALIYSLCADRKRWRSTLPLFIPAILFALLHLFVIPKHTGPYYKIQIDARIFSTLLQYLKWSLGPTRLYELTLHWGRFGTRIMWITAATLTIFTIVRLLRLDWRVAFFCAWFLLLIAPVLPLPNHVVDYYASLAVLGLAWLAGWAITLAWNTNWLARGFAVALAACSLAGSIREVDAYTNWYWHRSIEIETAFFGIRDALRAHPGSALILHGVDNELFQAGFQDEPFRLLGFPKIYLAPGTEKGIVAREDLGGVGPFMISPRQALAMIANHQARVLSVSSDGIHDITSRYQLILHADPNATRVDAINVGDPGIAELLGPMWFPAEGGFRWMPKSATVRLSAPEKPGERLYLTGFAPAAILKSGPVTITVQAGNVKLGESKITEPDAPFVCDFPLPDDTVNQESTEITVLLDKVMHAPSDNRDLGIVFGTFSIH